MFTADLEAKLASFVEQNRLPGDSASVVCADDLAWSAGAGFADVAMRKTTEPTMLYGIASITKTFTGTAIMQLRDAGRLDLDDPAVRWLPELRSLVNPFGPVEAVTIRRMPGATPHVLDAASLREMHKPRYLADDQWTQAWGISWCGTRRDDTVWIGHAGAACRGST